MVILFQTQCRFTCSGTESTQQARPVPIGKVLGIGIGELQLQQILGAPIHGIVQPLVPCQISLPPRNQCRLTKCRQGHGRTNTRWIRWQTATSGG